MVLLRNELTMLIIVECCYTWYRINLAPPLHKTYRTVAIMPDVDPTQLAALEEKIASLKIKLEQVRLAVKSGQIRLLACPKMQRKREPRIKD